METFDYADIKRRLDILADPERVPPANQPPLTTYVEDTSGRIPRITATPEFDAWFNRTYEPRTLQDAQQRTRVVQPDSLLRKQAEDRSRELVKT